MKVPSYHLSIYFIRPFVKKYHEQIKIDYFGKKYLDSALKAEQNEVLRYKLKDDKNYRLPLIELKTNKNTLALGASRIFFLKGKGTLRQKGWEPLV